MPPTATLSPPPRLTPSLLNRLTAAADVAKGRALHDVTAPFTGAMIAQVPHAEPDDVTAAFEAARKAQAAWVRRSFDQRAEVVIRYHDLLLQRQDEALDLMQWESGKARLHAFEEVADTAIVSRYYAHHAERHLSTKRRAGALPFVTKTVEHRHPVGVVGIIAPWNYPLTMAITDAIPALMAGNAVVLKPSELTPLTALWAVALFREAGLPDGLMQILPGEGPHLGPALLAQADYVHFTGSTDVGRLVAETCGRALTGCSLELGGKNPLLVLDDADVDAAAEGAVRGVFTNAGQLCISIERIYVARRRYDAFLDRFIARTEAMTVGATLDFDSEMGSLISQEQFDKVDAHVRDAIEKGATVHTGGHARPDLGPLFYAPTVLSGVTPAMTLYREETFGPVVALYPVADDEEAVARANDSAYGLNGSVWTRSEARGLAVAQQLRMGTVNVNEAYAAAWASVDAPMGGFKDSGLGRRHGAAGIQKYTELQTVAVQKLLPLTAPPVLGSERYTFLLSQLLSVLRRVPGLR